MADLHELHLCKSRKLVQMPVDDTCSISGILNYMYVYFVVRYIRTITW